jgi:hypothetical protein
MVKIARYIILIAVWIIAESVVDGMHTGDMKQLSHLLKLIELGAPLLMIYWLTGNNWRVILVYVLFRVALFDIGHNIAAGLPWTYCDVSNRWAYACELLNTLGGAARVLALFIAAIMIVEIYNRR